MPAYDFKKVTLAIENLAIGNVIITGFGEGDDVINVVRNDDGISMATGAKGFVTTSKIANPTGTISVTLQAQSPSNSVFNSLANTKESVSVSIIENNSQKLQAGGAVAYVVKEADNGRGKNAGERSWDIMVEELNISE